MELGQLHDVGLQEYLSSPGVSKSGLDRLLRSPLHFAAGAKDSTAATRRGSLLHCLALEPDRFEERYWTEPDPSSVAPDAANPRATKAWKALIAELEEENAGKERVSPADLGNARRLAKAIRASGVFQNLCGGEPLCERSIWYEEKVYLPGEDEPAEVLCKARPDALFERDEDVIVLDLKSARDASPDGWMRQAANLRYHVSAYMTARAVWSVYQKPVHWIALCFEAEPVGEVYPTAFYCATRERGAFQAYRPGVNTKALAAGEHDTHAALRLYVECERAGRWPGYAGGLIADYPIPNWLDRRVTDERAAELAESDPF